MNFREDLEQIKKQSMKEFLEQYKDYEDDEYLENIVNKFLNDIFICIKSLKAEELLTIQEIEFMKITIKSSKLGKIHVFESPRMLLCRLPDLLSIPDFAIDKVFIKVKNRLIKEGFEIKDKTENIFVLKI